MNDDVFRMNCLTPRFAGAAVEAAYADGHARKSVRPIRILLAFLILLTDLVYLLRISLAPSGIVARPGGSMEGRLAVVTVVCASVYALSRWPLFLRRRQTVLFAVFCLFSAMVIVATSRMPAEYLVTRG